MKKNLGLRVGLGLLATLCIVGPSNQSRAQSAEFDSQLFQPTTGLGTTFTVDRPEVPRHLTFSAGLGLNFATSVFVRGSDDEDIVPWRGDAELLASLGLFERLEIGLAMPVVLSNSSEQITGALEPTVGLSPGDLRLSIKMPILRGDFALAARAVFSLPTGNGGRFVGTDYWTATPALIAAWRGGGFAVALDVGYRFRRAAQIGELEYDDELHAALGVSYALVPALDIIAEAQARLGFAGQSFDADENPVEVDLGLRVKPASGLTIDVGAGIGVHQSYGAPGFRGFAILRYASERDDPCLYGPEDFDGFEDGDFCADPDNDGDGVFDVAVDGQPAGDECPNDPEDVDGFLDTDGCPDTDNDADGVLDAEDRCPVESEDRDGYQDSDGCPEPDNDEDGIADGADECPMEPEDADNYQDEDGCPEPGPEEAVVTVSDTRILISERIYFDFNTDTIRSVSLPLLDQVADVIQQLAASKRIRVDGYTDSEGDDEYNRDLSYRRARAVVEYLVGRGVPRERIEYVGYGEANPVAPNDDPAGRALNRRVEFTILEPTDANTNRRRRRRR